MNLTPQDIEALRRGEAVRVASPPEVGSDVVVIRSDVYERTRALLPDEVVGALVDETMSEYDENDPLLRSYQ